MMKRQSVLAVFTALGLSMGTAAGTGGTAPEQLGAHWARVSDGAQIQFLIDGLRSAAPGSVAEKPECLPMLSPWQLPRALNLRCSQCRAQPLKSALNQVAG
jgi:hypothetical protein